MHVFCDRCCISLKCDILVLFRVQSRRSFGTLILLFVTGVTCTLTDHLRTGSVEMWGEWGCGGVWGSVVVCVVVCRGVWVCGGGVWGCVGVWGVCGGVWGVWWMLCVLLYYIVLYYEALY